MSDYKGDNILEKLGSFVPGYAGYAQREGRRKTDKMLRESLARLLDQQKRVLDSAVQMILKADAIHLAPEIDAVKREIDTTASQIRYAPCGSSGFFDLVQVKEPELDRLYACDLALKTDCEALPPILVKLTNADEVTAICHEARECLTAIQEAVVRRRTVMEEV